MRKVVVVDAVRTPFGRRDGQLSAIHASHLLADVLSELLRRHSLDGSEIGQVLGGCVSQVGMQTGNVARTAWLTAGLPIETPATTVDAQCGSSQQGANIATALIASSVVDAAIACGVEMMSTVKMGSTVPKDPSVGVPVTDRYREHRERTTQFEGAERIADKWGVTRRECDEFGLISQQRAARATAQGVFSSQLIPVTLPDGSGTATRDEGIRDTSLESLARLKPTGRPDGVHTAGTSSQIADGASAVLLMSETRASQLGLRPLAEVVSTCLVGSDPVLMLTGPIYATQKILSDTGLTIDDLSLVEINEAFASVVLAWQRETTADMDRVNPNGGAIGMGHPLGATGSALIAKAVHELHRSDGEHALVTMCCGGGLGTGTLLRRV